MRDGRIGVLALLWLVGAAPAAPAGAQPAADELRALRQEVEALRQEQAKLRAEMQALRELLQGRRAVGPPERPPAEVSLALGERPTAKGDPGAPLVLVEFTDYQ